MMVLNILFVAGKLNIDYRSTRSRCLCTVHRLSAGQVRFYVHHHVATLIRNHHIQPAMRDARAARNQVLVLVLYDRYVARVDADSIEYKKIHVATSPLASFFSLSSQLTLCCSLFAVAARGQQPGNGAVSGRAATVVLLQGPDNL
jgi:hypothetical protein